MVRSVAFLMILLVITFSPAHPQTKPDGNSLLRPVTVAELRDFVRRDSGKVVLLNVWATWCKWCKEEMPAILTLRRRLGPKGLAVIIVSADDIDELESVVIPAARSLGLTFPTYIMRDSTEEAFITGMNPAWNGALPTTFLYDRSGAQVDMLVGERTLKELERRILLYLR